MRIATTLGLLFASGALASQDPALIPTPDPRFGVAAKIKQYPQGTAKQVLRSAIDASDRGNFAYLLAHLLDPAFVDARLIDRARQFEGQLEDELARLRDYQLRNKDKFPPENRLPTNRIELNRLVVERSRERAFQQLTKDVQQKFLNDPQSLKELKKILREGTFSDEPDGSAKATHPEIRNRAVYFRKIDERWFLENRQDEPPKKDPGK